MKCRYFILFCLLLPSHATLPMFSMPEPKSLVIPGGCVLLGFGLAYMIFWSKNKRLTEELQSMTKNNNALIRDLDEAMVRENYLETKWKTPTANSIAAALLKSHKNSPRHAWLNLIDIAAVTPAIFINRNGNLVTTRYRVISVVEE
jgi:hypothetical protein